MSRILVVDDEANLRKVLAAILRKDGYEVTVAEDGEQALAEFEKNGADVIISDLVMPKLGGMDILHKVRASRSAVPVIIITAHGTVDSAVEAIKLGAFDYITKPFEHAEIRAVVAKAARTQEANQGHVAPDGSARKSIIGGGSHMEDLFKVIDKVADTPSTVLITGESGTGKELVATALHQGSSRRDKPLIKINCAAIPKDLMESELFGYERGAFTGAVSSKPGRFELADGGTLFLDEIGEVPIEMQVKLLRVLQESEFERVGGIKTTRVDVRLIAATNRDLARETEAGRFRKDLFYRLNVVPIVLPPLRDRADDIPQLVVHFIEKYNKRLNKKIETISDEALVLLQAWPWPGNIRELENLMERVLLFADGPRIEVKDLPEGVRGGMQAAPSYSSGATPAPGETPLKDFLKQKQAEIEKSFIVQALAKTEGNVTRAAKLLQISRKSLQTKMKEFGLRDEEPVVEE
ncbi:MAG: sigma-54 dependent transcriptional regulator [Archangium sp.]|nr:sigma-54 dependent transcriptional regulator [Archangium sp.]MDP3156577.1 sigma-54 dependent transcriptional regulator [Archangium sp.]MDP3576322.1 sigma-54 dependent transcriptional regulator [Archangium sp.]